MDTNLEKICKNGDIEQLNSAAVKSLSLKIVSMFYVFYFYYGFIF